MSRKDKETKLEGKNPVLEALKAGRPIHRIFIAKGSQGSAREIVKMARDRNIPIQEMEGKDLQAKSETRSPQGIMAITSKKEYASWPEMVDIALAKKEDPFLVILDGIKDPQNLGAIIRTCEAAGVHGVIVGKHRSAGLTETVSKTSAGAVEFVPVARVTNISATIDDLKDKGLWIVGADIKGRDIFEESQMAGPTALVIGSEDKGISRLVGDKCDFLVRIPMKGSIQSMNASAAAAVLIFEIVRQKKEAKTQR